MSSYLLLLFACSVRKCRELIIKYCIRADCMRTSFDVRSRSFTRSLRSLLYGFESPTSVRVWRARNFPYWCYVVASDSLPLLPHSGHISPTVYLTSFSRWNFFRLKFTLLYASSPVGICSIVYYICDSRHVFLRISTCFFLTVAFVWWVVGVIVSRLPHGINFHILQVFAPWPLLPIFCLLSGW